MRDELEFKEYVDARWWARFNRLALLLTGAEAAAQDLVQVTLEKTYVAWPRIGGLAGPRQLRAPDHGQPLVSSHRRARQASRGPDSEPPDHGRPASGTACSTRSWCGRWCARAAAAAGGHGPSRLRGPVRAEIADVLGCAVGTVKSTAHDAMGALRRGVAAVPTAEGATDEPGPAPHRRPAAGRRGPRPGVPGPAVARRRWATPAQAPATYAGARSRPRLAVSGRCPSSPIVGTRRCHQPVDAPDVVARVTDLPVGASRGIPYCPGNRTLVGAGPRRGRVRRDDPPRRSTCCSTGRASTCSADGRRTCGPRDWSRWFPALSLDGRGRPG